MLPFLILLFTYFSGRLFFFDINCLLFGSKLQPVTLLKRILWGLVIFVLLPFPFPAVWFFVGYLFLCVWDSIFIPQNEKMRLIFYILQLLAPLIFLLFPVTVAGKMVRFPILANIRFWLILNGFLFTIKEGTIIIRWALNSLRAVPLAKKGASITDTEEYERGKWIGILERSFIYFLVLFDQVGAIGLIIALKSLARFNELNQKSFAEYFLIGSLLSLLVATVPAVIVRLLW